MIINFEIKNPLLISTNEAYYHPVRKTKTGRYMSYVCKSESLKKLQEFYKEKLLEAISDKDVDNLRDDLESGITKGVVLELFVGMPEKEIFEHDSSNYIKALEDCIVNRIKIDDSRNHCVSIEKFIYKPTDEEISEGISWILLCQIHTEEIKRFTRLNNYKGPNSIF